MIAFALVCTTAWRAEADIDIQLNEDFIRSLHARQEIDDTLGVFARVFAELPPKVFVYPTENYYYFSFVANGRAYSGNLRLSPDAWSTRRIHFAYGEKADAAGTRYLHLGPEHGVLVEPIGHLRYRVSFADKHVELELNGLPESPPQGLRLYPWEVLIGRSMDESGMGFVLMYNLAHDHFFWLLDETVGPTWPMRTLGPHVRQHPDSGFVFFEDAALGRRILIGVDRSEVVSNSYYDGPFDQLPDNVLARTPFAELAQRAFPALRGRINRRGEYHDRPIRIALLNYRIYSDPRETVIWANNCAARTGRRPDLYACLTHLSRSP
jgi:hypothetical protein